MKRAVLASAPFSHHSLHAADRVWTETNCYVDLWIELLHALGQDPLAACAFVLSADFKGDQWTFIKYPPEDLRLVYGIDVGELAIWRPVVDHVVDHLAFGRLLTVEVDSWWLPDTAGTAYRGRHVKTTVVPIEADRERRTMQYFHNSGCFALQGDDFDGVFAPVEMPPYVEVIDLEHLIPAGVDRRELALSLARHHLDRSPTVSAVDRLAERVRSDMDGLAEAGLEAFHDYAFVMVRQFGATAELAASFAEWLHDEATQTGGAVEQFMAAATAAKSLEFGLARVAHGRSFDPSGALRGMSVGWTRALEAFDTCLG